jgi:putative ABC transport system ATP-binding protein
MTVTSGQEQASTDAVSADPLVRLTRVSKSFSAYGGQAPVLAVHAVSLSVDSGSVVALTGPSGSGKSTLLHLIGAIERSDEGSIRVAGHTLDGMSAAASAAYRRTIGLIFQRFHLLPALTALDNVIVPTLPFRTEFDRVDRARELLMLVGLEDKAAALPARMSGGQQQRVAIARALMNRPSLLLADEPTGNLDQDNSTAIMDLLLRLRAEEGMTIIIATHDADIAARCDRVLRMRDGGLMI